MPSDVEIASLDLENALAALRRDYGKLAPRIRELAHTVTCACDGVVLRLHFPSFRQNKATMAELVEAITRHMLQFSLSRSKIDELEAKHSSIEMDEFLGAYEALRSEAYRIFMQANKNTHRNGEAGELLLYLLTEWVLGAPQILAKMSLKTNRDMPVHGSDGVHARYCSTTNRLLLYWGESKLHAKVSDAITDALKSVAEALTPGKMQHEIDLVQRNIDFSGLPPEARAALLRFLDPFEEDYNARHDVITCLVGFDFDGFEAVTQLTGQDAETAFVELARARLTTLAPQVAEKMTDHGIAGQPIELFFFPVPAVDDFRKIFQDKIGWKS